MLRGSELEVGRWLRSFRDGCLIVAIGAVLVGMTAHVLSSRAERQARDAARWQEAERLSRHAIPTRPRLRCDGPRAGAGVEQWNAYFECLDRGMKTWSAWLETYGWADALQHLRAFEAAAESDDPDAVARLIRQQEHADD